jgi:hypothetical protein
MKMDSRSRELDKIYKRRDRYEIPDWQREKVWSRPKKQKLIDTILRGWRLPKLYLVRTSKDPEEFEVVDGQQRLQAIFEFFSNDLPLSKESQVTFGAEYYKDLPDELADRFDDFPIDYDEIEEATDEELKDFFQRLQEGLPLNASEKLNAVHSNLRDFVRELAAHPFLRNKTAVSAHRYGHFDVAAKVAALEADGIEAGLRYEDIKGIFESQKAFSKSSNVAKRLKATFDALDHIFPTKNPQLRNRSVVQSFATLISRFVEAHAITGNELRIRAFFISFLAELSRQVELGQAATDSDYVRFQRTVNANVKSGVRVRQEVLLRKLAGNDPDLFAGLGTTLAAQAGFNKRIPELGTTVTQLIDQVNTEHAARCGDDFFKMTNKTAQALTRISKPVSDVKSYETLVDDLYFLFREGPGSRLKDVWPTSFSEVNDLRTDLRHDVDHGTSGKVRSKRKKLSATFAKYAGSASPQTLPVERFPMIQSGLLTALERDLRGILRDIQAGRLGGSTAPK